MTPLESFVSLFNHYDILSVCMWVTGFVLISIEFFQPMHGISYCLGGLLICSAFVTRMTYGSPGEGFMFVLMTSILMFAVHAVSQFTQKRDWLRVSRMEQGGAKNISYETLVGSVGIANTPIDLVGNVIIDDVNLVVYSENPIGQGEKVVIVSVSSDKITVERAYS